ncbi:zinc finger HIT domain-containing protein 1-like protein [Leptotrombidium deliense]|uniref:Zinc finger HIT domain-containing protein 1-like protein n=1 Tax=Leptotrombidium deliense TaxID=299467 RepID=A0A443S460_9ACAR|nr:zinc finger HIT domain-containing protein 1-like protein [Leptotrombidium deliense]
MSKQHRSQYRVLDEAARNRRIRQQLEQLERDNFHEDPHANLVMHKKAPKFDDTAIKVNTPNSTSSSRRHLHRLKIASFSALIEEDMKNREVNYSNASAPPPDNVVIDGKKLFTVPKRHFCCVCGFKAPYTCVTCGMRYCCVTCLKTHQDTRCLKWTV